MIEPRQPNRLLWIVAAFAMLLPAKHLRAADPDTEIRVARLIGQLGSDSYRDRVEAGQQLSALGPSGRRGLDAAAQSADPEVRLRAEELLMKLKTADLWNPAAVSLDSRGEPLSQAIGELVRQSGNHVLFGDPYGKFVDAKADLDYPSGTFWPVLDDLCRQTGNHLRPHFDGREPGCIVLAAPAGKFPTAYAGPCRAQLTESLRSFSEKLNYAELNSDRTHTFELEMQVVWEDRLHLVAYRAQPELIEAVTDTGMKLVSQQQPGSSWSVAGTNLRQLSTKLNVSPPPVAAKELDRLTVRWGLMAVGEQATLAVDDFTSKEPHRQDDLELTVCGMERQEGGRVEITFVVSRDQPLPDPQEILFQEYTVELFDAQGRALRNQGQSNLLTDRGAQIRATFSSDPDQSPPKTLRLTYPRIRDRHDMDFTFRHVPLPTARPE